jgi:protein gp37
MADGTKIEWTDATWNPVTGCSVVSPGCTNCYAMRLAGTRLKHHPTRAGLTTEVGLRPSFRTDAAPDGAPRPERAEGDSARTKHVWNGQVRLNREALQQPLGWKRPRMIFVCAHGDLFHEAVPDEWIDQVFAVMALCPQHTFQVLTKRSARMRAYLDWSQRPYRIASSALHTGRNLPDGHPGWSPSRWKHSPIRECTAPARWPLPNVWLGVSAEDQRRADERIPELLATPAAIRFLSAEPLLDPIDLRTIDPRIFSAKANALTGVWRWDDGPSRKESPRLDWVIVGGESGPGARPMHPEWARSIRDQCAAAEVPFFFKQWGGFRSLTKAEHDQACGATLVHGADPHDPDSYMLPATKKRAGRLLDGVEHSAFPEARS